MLNKDKTIGEIEASIQNSLRLLKDLPFNENVRAGLSCFFQQGFDTVVQVEDTSRRVRSSTPASTLNPETLEIVVRFERGEKDRSAETPPSFDSVRAEPSVTEQQIQQCCVALAEEEKAGKVFIALKWFRDDALPSHGFPWVNDADERQRVLTKAIEDGRIKTGKIANPHSPKFPTTVVSLNRSEPIPGVRPRFRPVPVKGEPVSTTILRDRGSY